MADRALAAVPSLTKQLTCEVCGGGFDHPATARGPNPRKCPRAECQVVKLPDRRSSNGKRRARMNEAELRDDLMRERLDPLWSDQAASVVLDEIVKAGVQAGGMAGADRQVIHGKVIGLARAQGQDGNYLAALELAAAAVAFAARIRPVEGGPARPDFDTIPARIAEGEQRLLVEAA